MRWTCVRNLKVPVFVGLVFIILIRNIQDLQNDICCITKKKQSALWFTNDLWHTELIIDSVHFWHLSTHICLTGSPVHDQLGDQFIYWQEPDIVLTYRFSEASVSILMIKAIKFELITCNFQPKRKKEVRDFSSPLEGGAKWLRKNIPKLWIYVSHICKLRGEELYGSRLSQL